MKIIYKQPESGAYAISEHASAVMNEFGIKNCFLKFLSVKYDARNIVKKAHHHTGFEIHMLAEGCQYYDVEGKIYKVPEGSYLLIPPEIKHRIAESTPHALKYSLTFSLDNTSPLANFSPVSFSSDIPSVITESLNSCVKESAMQKNISPILIGNRVFEIIIILLRAQGLNEADAAKFFTEEDIRITLAKQYINDNIEHLFNCDEIAKYCYLSKKQMTRLFRQCDGISPLEYINNQKVSYIEKLLIDTPLSLKEISEKMNFSSEYYFSAFFKKHSGMPPGAYRKMYK